MGVNQQKQASRRRPSSAYVKTICCRQTDTTEMSWCGALSAFTHQVQSNPWPQKLSPSVSGGLFEPLISFPINFETPGKETKPKLTPWAQETLHTILFSFCRIKKHIYVRILNPSVWSTVGAVLGVTWQEKMVLVCPPGHQYGCAEGRK